MARKIIEGTLWKHREQGVVVIVTSAVKYGSVVWHGGGLIGVEARKTFLSDFEPCKAEMIKSAPIVKE